MENLPLKMTWNRRKSSKKKKHLKMPDHDQESIKEIPKRILKELIEKVEKKK